MLGILISYINCLVEYGAIAWFNGHIADFVGKFHYKLYVLTTIYFFAHYFFSGEGTKIIALNLPFLLTGLSFGLDKMELITTLSLFSTASSVISNYSGPVAIMMYNTGYTKASRWFLIGLVFSAVIITTWFICL